MDLDDLDHRRAWYWRDSGPVPPKPGSAVFERVAWRALWKACSELPYQWYRSIASRACDLVLGEPVSSWAEWQEAHAVPPRAGGAPHFFEQPLHELAQALTRLRADFTWLNLRRRRVYERPLANHAYDAGFCGWLRSLDDATLQEHGQRFVRAWPEQIRSDEARLRLALLMPMPLALLRQAHAFNCARTDALAGCNSVEDVQLEYVTLFAATHTCRALADYQRFHVDEKPQFAHNYWSPLSLDKEAPEAYIRRMLDEVDLERLPEPLIEAFVRYRLRADVLAPAPVLRWQAVLGPMCAVCSAAKASERDGATQQASATAELKWPPFRAGCTCECIFDPENDPFMEAPADEDVARWCANGGRRFEFPGMRVLLSLSQQAGATAV